MATKKYFGEETATTKRKRRTTRKTKTATRTRRTRKATTVTRARRPRNANVTPEMVMIPVPANLAFQIGLSLGRQLNG